MQGLLQKKPLLSDKHKRERLVFAQKYCYWIVEDWREVPFGSMKQALRLASKVSSQFRMCRQVFEKYK